MVETPDGIVCFSNDVSSSSTDTVGCIINANGWKSIKLPSIYNNTPGFYVNGKIIGFGADFGNAFTTYVIDKSGGTWSTIPNPNNDSFMNVGGYGIEFAYYLNGTYFFAANSALYYTTDLVRYSQAGFGEGFYKVLTINNAIIGINYTDIWVSYDGFNFRSLGINFDETITGAWLCGSSIYLTYDNNYGSTYHRVVVIPTSELGISTSTITMVDVDNGLVKQNTMTSPYTVPIVVNGGFL